MLIFEMSSNIKYVYKSMNIIKIAELINIRDDCFNVDFSLIVDEKMMLLLKNSIANSASEPRLIEYLQLSIRHDFPNKLDVEINRFFCKNMIMRYKLMLAIKNDRYLCLALSDILYHNNASDFVKIIINNNPKIYDSRSFIFA